MSSLLHFEVTPRFESQWTSSQTGNLPAHVMMVYFKTSLDRALAFTVGQTRAQCFWQAMHSTIIGRLQVRRGSHSNPRSLHVACVVTPLGDRFGRSHNPGLRGAFSRDIGGWFRRISETYRNPPPRSFLRRVPINGSARVLQLAGCVSGNQQGAEPLEDSLWAFVGMQPRSAEVGSGAADGACRPGPCQAHSRVGAYRDS